jgi:transposase, IS30 family
MKRFTNISTRLKQLEGLFGRIWDARRRKKRYSRGVSEEVKLPIDALSARGPADVDIRRILRHWEGETVIREGQKQVIMTLIERNSGYARLMKVSHKKSKQIFDEVVKKLRSINARVKTITFDNGKEFAEHARIVKALGSTKYFKDPFRSR